jgi:hypothetical protein
MARPAYAFGAGKAVISTRYWHAAELLRDQRGFLVAFADPRAIAREVCGLLRNRTRRTTMSNRAYKLGRAMVWSNTAGLYLRSFGLARRRRAPVPRQSVAANGFPRRPHESPQLNLDQVYYMTDRTTSFRLHLGSDEGISVGEAKCSVDRKAKLNDHG